MRATTKRETATVTQGLPTIKDGAPVPSRYRGNKQASAEASFAAVRDAYRSLRK